MPMLQDPSTKYPAFAFPDLPNRTWPSKRLTQPPRWLSTDLRDGNQALAAPLTVEQKQLFFEILVKTGFREIEIGFPAASESDFRFVQQAVASAPDDVWLQVMCPCRREMIDRTIEAVSGAKKVIISLYIATSDLFLDTVFGHTREQAIKTATEHAAYLRSRSKDDARHKATQWNLMWSPENFSDTDVGFAIEICQAVQRVWEPTATLPMILNLPATVELSMPNVFADQVELFCRGFQSDETVCVSVHTHNDRGCAVAATELAQLAGASRVEGCLFGNGERTGNVDLVTLAMNLYTQGVNPGLDFSELPAIRETVEKLTQIPVHTRHPYAGDSVFLAYSGGHQDAIQKGFKKRKAAANATKASNGGGNIDSALVWKMPYLPLDPEDIGSSYEAVIRVNSQSGKGGISWVLEHSMGCQVPKHVLQQFGEVVKTKSEALGRSLEPEEIRHLFTQRQLQTHIPIAVAASC